MGNHQEITDYLQTEVTRWTEQGYDLENVVIDTQRVFTFNPNEPNQVGDAWVTFIRLKNPLNTD